MGKKKELFVIQKGSGPTLLLLHGMFSSSLTWKPVIDQLAKRFTVVVPDLLGFGRSPKPKTLSYTPEDHLSAILSYFTTHSVSFPEIIVGQSIGGLLAIRLASQHKQVKRLILMNPPLYRSKDDAKEKTMGLFGTPKGLQKTSIFLLLHLLAIIARPLLYVFRVHVQKEGTPEAFRDAYRHTWHSFSKTYEHTLLDTTITPDLSLLHIPITILYGDTDPFVDETLLLELAKQPNISVRKIPAGHHIMEDSDTILLELLLAHV